MNPKRAFAKISSGYTPWLVEHAIHALLPDRDNAGFRRQTSALDCQKRVQQHMKYGLFCLVPVKFPKWYSGATLLKSMN
jgi:hypothetical protein